jgi:hypothetical protein
MKLFLFLALVSLAACSHFRYLPFFFFLLSPYFTFTPIFSFFSLFPIFFFFFFSSPI